MGNTHTPYIYAEPISEPKKGESAIYRNPDVLDELQKTPNPKYKSYSDLLQDSLEKFADLPYIGKRETQSDGKLSQEFTFMTYKEVEQKARHLGSGIINLGLTKEKAQFQDYKIRFVSIYSANTVEWILTDIANVLYNFTTLPIYDTLGDEAIQHMFEETETTNCFTTCNHLSYLIEKINEKKLPNVENLVVLDSSNLTDDQRKALNDCQQIEWHTLESVIDSGKNNPQPYANSTGKDITAFSYTSGTTGKPKGAMFSQTNVLAAVTAMKGRVVLEPNEGVYLSYLPLAHVLEKIFLYYITENGGKIGVFNGNVQKLKEDLGALKPTVFVSVPRLYNKFYDKMIAGVRDLQGCKAKLAQKAIETKKRNHDESGQVTHWLYDKLVFKKFQQVLGGNVKYAISGSAPLSNDIKTFLKIAFGTNFIEGYGQTENLGASFTTVPIEKNLDIIGGPLNQCEYKLVDIPDMNYLSTDTDEQGRLQPRGEICVRGANVIPGYYKNEEKTKESIDSDGWLHSGDIGCIVPGINGLRIIDRKKNIFKLSQGEYVAPDKLQEGYKTVKGIADIFVHGESSKSSLIAIVNYDPEEISSVASELGVEGSFEEICKDEKVHEQIGKSLMDCAKQCNFKGFEKIRKFWVDPATFEKNDLLTTSFKLKRHEAKKHYEDKIKELYQGMN